MSVNHWTSLVSILLLLWTVDLVSTQGEAPSQVTGVSLSKVVRQGKPSLSVTWTTPQSDGTIFQYQVEYRRSGSTSWGSHVTITGSLPATSITLMTLDAGTEYNVRVRAVSAFGDGEWSEVQTERTFDIPSRVSHVLVTRTMTSGKETLIVAWPFPQSDVAISQYQVQYRRSGTTSWNNASALSGSPPANSTTLTRLDSGTEYTVRVRAVSEIGDGAWSVEHTGRTFGFPSRVSNVTLTKTLASGVSALIVAWPTPQSDVAISQYQVQYRKRGTISWNNVTVITVLPQTIYAILTGLDADTEYTVKVRAVSEIGAGEWSLEQIGKTFDGADDHSCASGTDNSLQQSGIVAAVCTCQVEVALVAIVTGLVVYFVTKRAVQQHPNSGQDGSGNAEEPTGLVKKHVTYESASDGDATGQDIVEMQLSPAYRSISKK